MAAKSLNSRRGVRNYFAAAKQLPYTYIVKLYALESVFHQDGVVHANHLRKGELVTLPDNICRSRTRGLERLEVSKTFGMSVGKVYKSYYGSIQKFHKVTASRRERADATPESLLATKIHTSELFE